MVNRLFHGIVNASCMVVFKTCKSIEKTRKVISCQRVGIHTVTFSIKKLKVFAENVSSGVSQFGAAVPFFERRTCQRSMNIVKGFT
jgi:hypothetical protein